MLRFLLIFRYKERVTQTPAIPPLNRERIKEQEGREPVDGGFCLKRSGAVVRSVRNSNIVPNRMWTPPAPPICSDRSESNVQCSPSSRKNIIIAEVSNKLILGVDSTGNLIHRMEKSGENFGISGRAS